MSGYIITKNYQCEQELTLDTRKATNKFAHFNQLNLPDQWKKNEIAGEGGIVETTLLKEYNCSSEET